MFRPRSETGLLKAGRSKCAPLDQVPLLSNNTVVNYRGIFNPTISTMLNHRGILSLTPSTNGIKQYSGVFYHSLVILFYNTL
jgi:hypothetical protein